MVCSSCHTNNWKRCPRLPPSVQLGIMHFEDKICREGINSCPVVIPTNELTLLWILVVQAEIRMAFQPRSYYILLSFRISILYAFHKKWTFWIKYFKKFWESTIYEKCFLSGLPFLGHPYFFFIFLLHLLPSFSGNVPTVLMLIIPRSICTYM